jgi:hypothetical protein
MIKLSILIPTLPEREKQLNRLVKKLHKQIEGYENDVEIIIDKRGREIPISQKRMALYLMANGVMSVQLDDDDDISDKFVENIIKILRKRTLPDCIGYLEEVRIKSQVRISSISLSHKEWESFKYPINGLHYIRSPFYKCPINTAICKKIKLPEMRYAEDHEFSKQVRQLLTNEVFINEIMYIYIAPPPNTSLKDRYGA